MSDYLLPASFITSSPINHSGEPGSGRPALVGLGLCAVLGRSPSPVALSLWSQAGGSCNISCLKSGTDFCRSPGPSPALSPACCTPSAGKSSCGPKSSYEPAPQEPTALAESHLQQPSEAQTVKQGLIASSRDSSSAAQLQGPGHSLCCGKEQALRSDRPGFKPQV